MYAYPVLLPAITNREDFLKTVGLFDDFTGQPIDVSGRTLKNPGDFTAANWTVVDGLINTVSVSQITIKDYPFGNEMQQIPLTVAPNLAILAGDFITVADVLTGLNTLYGYVTSYVAATGALVIQVGVAFDFEMRGSHHHNDFWCDYGSPWGIGTDSSDTPIVQAQLGSGITVVGVGVIQIKIPAATLFKTRHRSYNIAMAAYLGGDTRQIFLGKQPILYGGLSTQPIAPVAVSNPFGLP